MSKRILIKNATIVNEDKKFIGHVLIEGEWIKKVSENEIQEEVNQEIDAKGMLLIPGIIDDQVHFREPGLTHKADIYHESRAAVAGGITSFMEMPNTVPNALTQKLLQDKYDIAAESSIGNYSFFMGASNDNLQEVLRTDPKNVCGIKIFMGSSTGNMLVDERTVLEQLFKECKLLIATHCEDEATIRANTAYFKEKYGEDLPIKFHPQLRSEEACYKSSSLAVELATKYNSRLHVLHISTEKETHLFRNDIPLKDKKITAEACIHHLWFTDQDYDKFGTLIKWNPAVKSAKDKEGIWQAVLDNRIDIIATDHAPHTIEEKNNSYFNAPSGGPLVQHALVAMIEQSKKGRISLEQMVRKMCHAPAECFQLEKRGFIKEGYFADLVLVNLDKPWTVKKDTILSKCQWSPFMDYTFSSSVDTTFINGQIAYQNGQLNDSVRGKRLTFDR